MAWAFAVTVHGDFRARCANCGRPASTRSVCMRTSAPNWPLLLTAASSTIVSACLDGLASFVIKVSSGKDDHCLFSVRRAVFST